MRVSTRADVWVSANLTREQSFRLLAWLQAEYPGKEVTVVLDPSARPAEVECGLRFTDDKSRVFELVDIVRDDPLRYLVKRAEAGSS